MLTVFGSIAVDMQVVRPPGGHTPTAYAPLDMQLTPGGTGANQAHGARRFGVPTRLVGAVGADPYGVLALSLLRQHGVDVARVRALPHTHTGLALLGGAQSDAHAVTLAAGANDMATAEQVDDADWDSTRVLLLQLELPWTQSKRLARRARKRAITVVLDAAGLADADVLDLTDIDVLALRRPALLRLAQRCGCRKNGPFAQAQELADYYQLRLLVGLDMQGAVLAAAGRRLLRVPAIALPQTDARGTGDTFVGVFAAALAAGYMDLHALRLATVAAALAGSRPGIQSAQAPRAVIDAYYRRHFAYPDGRCGEYHA